MLVSYERAKEIAGLYYNDVYHFCLLRLQNEDEAAEVTQKVFLFFQEQCDELEDKCIRAWLYSVADNKIKEEFREIVKRERELIFGTVFGKNTSTDILYEIEQDNKITQEDIEKKKKEILSSLSEKELKLFEMVYNKHMGYAELAKALDITENAARTRVFRLKTKIKEKASFAFMALLLLIIRV